MSFERFGQFLVLPPLFASAYWVDARSGCSAHSHASTTTSPSSPEASKKQHAEAVALWLQAESFLMVDQSSTSRDTDVQAALAWDSGKCAPRMASQADRMSAKRAGPTDKAA